MTAQAKTFHTPLQDRQQACRTIAVFDFDGTLTRRDSLFPFLKHSAGRFGYYRRLLTVAPVLAGYFTGLIPGARAKQRVLIGFLRDRQRDEMEKLAQSFAARAIPGLLRAEAVAKLQWHLDQRHETVLLSASPELYLRPWAEQVGIRHVLATRLEEVDGRLTGRFLGNNCYGPEKVSRLTGLLGELQGCEIYAYGDSEGDRELLAAATRPYYRCFDD